MLSVGVNMPRANHGSCYKCEKRTVGCHSKCGEYMDERQARYEEWQRRVEDYNKRNIVNGFKAEAVMKTTRRKPIER